MCLALAETPTQFAKSSDSDLGGNPFCDIPMRSWHGSMPDHTSYDDLRRTQRSNTYPVAGTSLAQPLLLRDLETLYSLSAPFCVPELPGRKKKGPQGTLKYALRSLCTHILGFTGTATHPWRYPLQIIRPPVCADVGETRCADRCDCLGYKYAKK